MHYTTEEEPFYEKVLNRLFKIYRSKIDKYIIHTKKRWTFTILVITTYCYRVLTQGGFYVVSYLLGLYMLHLMI